MPPKKQVKTFSDNSSAPQLPSSKPGRKPGSGGSFSREQQQKGAAAAAERRADGDMMPGDTPRTQPEDPDSEHTARERKQQAAWEKQKVELQAQFYGSLPTNLARARDFRDARQEVMQQDLDGAWRNHACSTSLMETDFRSEKGQGQVTYMGLECTFSLTVHQWTCTCCNQKFAPNALSFGCFPSTPEVAHLWYDLRVLQQYKRLGLGNGTSATCDRVGLGRESELVWKEEGEGGTLTLPLCFPPLKHFSSHSLWCMAIGMETQRTSKPPNLRTHFVPS